jgi:hypothetical protein
MIGKIERLILLAATIGALVIAASAGVRPL